MSTLETNAPIKLLDTSEVLSIIDACARHGVSTLKFRGLKITFGSQAQVSPESEVPPEPTNTELPLNIDTKMSELRHRSDQSIPFGWEQLGLEQKEDYIAELQLTDPLAAEELIERGELIDADDELGDDE